MPTDILGRIALLASVKEAVEQPSDEDWLKAEEELQIRLPLDYKKLITILGNGNFGELVLFNPVSSSEYTILNKENLLAHCSDVSAIVKNCGQKIFPERDGFLYVGCTGNGIALLLKTGGACQIPYEIGWLETDYEKLCILSKSITEFIFELFMGRITHEWAITGRDLIWTPEDKFFTPRKGLQKP